MNIPVNVVEMKLKTQIENNLLIQINTNLKECVDDLEYIYKNYKYSSNIINCIGFIENIFPNKIISLENLVKKQNLQSRHENIMVLVEKLFTHTYQFYWIFQYFYLKKKDFMGMNLTGLVNGRMETGLSFRNTISKISFDEFITKVLNLQKDILNTFINLDDNLVTNINVYKVKSLNFKWNEEGFDKIYDYFWIISDLNSKEYFIMITQSNK